MLTEHGTGLTRRLSGKAERAWGNFLRVRSDRRARYWWRRYFKLAYQYENYVLFRKMRGSALDQWKQWSVENVELMTRQEKELAEFIT